MSNPKYANLGFADIKALCGVSRLTAMQYAHGPDRVTDPKMVRLAKIVATMRQKDIGRPDTLLKMKTFGRKSLLELIRDGEDTDANVQHLIKEAALMQKAYDKSDLAKSKAPATEDWRSCISIAGGGE